MEVIQNQYEYLRRKKKRIVNLSLDINSDHEEVKINNLSVRLPYLSTKN